MRASLSVFVVFSLTFPVSLSQFNSFSEERDQAWLLHVSIYLFFLPPILLYSNSLVPPSSLVKVWGVSHVRAADDYFYHCLHRNQSSKKREWKHRHSDISTDTENVSLTFIHTFPLHRPVVHVVFSLSSQRWSSVIAALADMERHVRRLLEGSGASARLDGLAGPASWVSGI